MKLLVRIAVPVALVGLGIWVWLYFHPGPAEAIRRQIKGLAEAASFESREPYLKRGAAAQEVAGYFAPQVTLNVEPRRFFPAETSRPEIAQQIGILRSLDEIPSLRVAFFDPVIEVAADKQTAAVDLTLNVENGLDKHFMVQELRLHWRQIEGNWLIEHVETVRTLR